MKVKVTITEFREEETEHEYPIYLYYQDEMCNDQYVKMTDKYSVSITIDNMGVNINKIYGAKIGVGFEKDLTTEKHYNDFLKEALEAINK